MQSVAVRLIAESEREINAFTATSTFKIEALFTANDVTGKAVTFAAEGKKIFRRLDAENFLKSCFGADYKVTDIQVKPARKSPAAPFTTSTLQQEASRKFGYSVSRTMQLAQKLYESGKITYMRTDSVNLSDTAMGDIAQPDHQPVRKNVTTNPANTRTRTNPAQEAHEAIRSYLYGQSAHVDDPDTTENCTS